MGGVWERLVKSVKLVLVEIHFLLGSSNGWLKADEGIFFERLGAQL